VAGLTGIRISPKALRTDGDSFQFPEMLTKIVDSHRNFHLRCASDREVPSSPERPAARPARQRTHSIRPHGARRSHLRKPAFFLSPGGGCPSQKGPWNRTKNLEEKV
jgi:hypothetical protein